jgi:putative sigma-54 modulation protein
MNVNIKAVSFKADTKLDDFIREKAEKLTLHYDGVIGCDVILKLDAAQKVSNKIVEMRVLIPGNDLFSKKQSNSFEEATDSAIDALRKQLQKHKEKLRGN